jgi:hypothetical protein
VGLIILVKALVLGLYPRRKWEGNRTQSIEQKYTSLLIMEINQLHRIEVPKFEASTNFSPIALRE